MQALGTDILQTTKDFINQLRKNIKGITMNSFTTTQFFIKIKFRCRLCLVNTVLMTPTPRTVFILLLRHLWDSLYSSCHLLDDALSTGHSYLHLISEPCGLVLQQCWDCINFATVPNRFRTPFMLRTPVCPALSHSLHIYPHTH